MALNTYHLGSLFFFNTDVIGIGILNI